MDKDPNALSAIEKARLLKQQKEEEKKAEEQKQLELEEQQKQSVQKELQDIDSELQKLTQEKAELESRLASVRGERLENISGQRQAVKELKTSEETEDVLNEEGMKEEIFGADDEALEGLKMQEGEVGQQIQELEEKIAGLQEKRTEVHHKTPEGLAELEKVENERREKQGVYMEEKTRIENALTGIQELKLKYQDLLDKKITIGNNIEFPENQELFEQKTQELYEEYEKSRIATREKKNELNSLKKGFLESASSFQAKRDRIEQEVKNLQKIEEDLGQNHDSFRLKTYTHPDRPITEIPKDFIYRLSSSIFNDIDIPRQGELNMTLGEYLELYQNNEQEQLKEVQAKINELNK
jgi:hypothetical protein